VCRVIAQNWGSKERCLDFLLEQRFKHIGRVRVFGDLAPCSRSQPTEELAARVPTVLPGKSSGPSMAPRICRTVSVVASCAV
jgi:hypothetical protein